MSEWGLLRASRLLSDGFILQSSGGRRSLRSVQVFFTKFGLAGRIRRREILQEQFT